MSSLTKRDEREREQVGELASCYGTVLVNTRYINGYDSGDAQSAKDNGR